MEILGRGYIRLAGNWRRRVTAVAVGALAGIAALATGAITI
jgi:hypothetical protein